MAFEDIVKKIGEDARTEAESLLSIAHAEADAIREKARREGEDLSSQLMEKARHRAEEHARRLETLAGLDLRKDVLKVKKNLIEEMFRRAEEEIINLPPDAYRAFLRPIILAEVETGNEELIFSSRHRTLFTDDFLRELNDELGPLKGRLQLSGESGDFSGGVVLRDGKKENNLTLKSLIEAQRDKLEPLVADILFGENKKNG